MDGRTESCDSTMHSVERTKKHTCLRRLTPGEVEAKSVTKRRAADDQCRHDCAA